MPDVGQTLMDVLQADGVDLHSDGHWLAGPCPSCGGRDRLMINPSRVIWACRSCHPQFSDVVGYVMHRDGVGFLEACRTLSLDPENPHQDREVEDRSSRPPEPDRQPDESWRARALELYEFAEQRLWSSDGDKARSWLAGRGLSGETLHRWRVGFFPGGYLYGFRTEERCVTIPWLLDGRLWGVRCRYPSLKSKYKWLRGSVPTVYGADTMAGHRIGILTEGEFDALLLHQEAGDLVGVATLGSASASLHTQAILRLLPLRRILLVLDADDAGTAGAARLGTMMGRAVQVRVPMGKDTTEFWQAGGNVRQWVRYLLAVHGAESEPETPSCVTREAFLAEVLALFPGAVILSDERTAA
ncbi:MAG TPA: toprim domain-containing protein [Candidatus Xenobia bacterium]|jgi:DNA primase